MTQDEDTNLNEPLSAIFQAIEGSTKATVSEANFVGLFDDLDVVAHQFR